MKTNRKLLKEYMQDDETWLEEKSKKKAKEYIGCKMSCCWGQGEIGETGFYNLARFSPEHFGDKSTILCCKTELIKDLI